MRHLVDTGILVRLFKRADPDCEVIRAALMRQITQSASRVLTLNGRDFTRYPGIMPVTPSAILQGK